MSLSHYYCPSNNGATRGTSYVMQPLSHDNHSHFQGLLMVSTCIIVVFVLTVFHTRRLFRRRNIITAEDVARAREVYQNARQSYNSLRVAYFIQENANDNNHQ